MLEKSTVGASSQDERRDKSRREQAETNRLAAGYLLANRERTRAAQMIGNIREKIRREQVETSGLASGYMLEKPRAGESRLEKSRQY